MKEPVINMFVNIHESFQGNIITGMTSNILEDGIFMGRNLSSGHSFGY
jgi:hypothetical protein